MHTFPSFPKGQIHIYIKLTVFFLNLGITSDISGEVNIKTLRRRKEVARGVEEVKTPFDAKGWVSPGVPSYYTWTEPFLISPRPLFSHPWEVNWIARKSFSLGLRDSFCLFKAKWWTYTELKVNGNRAQKMFLFSQWSSKEGEASSIMGIEGIRGLSCGP